MQLFYDFYDVVVGFVDRFHIFERLLNSVGCHEASPSHSRLPAPSQGA